MALCELRPPVFMEGLASCIVFSGSKLAEIKHAYILLHCMTSCAGNKLWHMCLEHELYFNEWFRTVLCYLTSFKHEEISCTVWDLAELMCDWLFCLLFLTSEGDGNKEHMYHDAFLAADI